jgi:4-hydroxybenzoate polyprenyltransferase
LHPSKSQRPIAARRVSIPVAIASCILLLLLSAIIVALYIPSLQVVAVLLTYLLLNIAYVFKLKHIAIVDVFVVALGFVLRILLGAAAVDVQASHWIIIMTFLLALFLVLAKRRDDVRKFEQTQTLMRSNISAYNCTFLDHSITLVSAVMLVSYIMYTVDAGNIARFDCNYIYATTIFVLAGLLRYLQITYVKEESWSPTRVIFHDPFLQSCVIGWLLLFAYIIYG